MADGSLSIADVEKLVAEKATQIDRAVTRDRVHVFEDPHSSDGTSLIVQIAARRPENRDDWTRLRLRFSQMIRDVLIQHGDDRFPLIQIFGPEEWAKRDD